MLTRIIEALLKIPVYMFCAIISIGDSKLAKEIADMAGIDWGPE